MSLKIWYSTLCTHFFIENTFDSKKKDQKKISFLYDWKCCWRFGRSTYVTSALESIFTFFYFEVVPIVFLFQLSPFFEWSNFFYKWKNAWKNFMSLLSGISWAVVVGFILDARINMFTLLSGKPEYLLNRINAYKQIKEIDFTSVFLLLLWNFWGEVRTVDHSVLFEF